MESLSLFSLTKELSQPVSDLTGMEYAVNIMILEIQNQNIYDITPLENLTNLSYLQLSNNDIVDISALSNLTNLKYLYLNNNDINNISALSNLTRLIELHLYRNQVSDISALSNLTNLKVLNLGLNKINDVSTLSRLTGVTNLNLSFNQISDISALSGFTNLTELRMTRNQVSDISALSNLTNLTNLYLDSNQISDVSALSNLTNLIDLNLSDNQISNISALSNLDNLTDLWLNNNQISDISALSNLTNLIDLNLSDNQISDISALSNLTNLKYLYLSDNQISNISALSGLINLIDLDLSDNQISNISALSGLINLIDLDLSDNQISDVSTLSNLTNLETLHLISNQISDISSLSNLDNLTELWLNNNQISDISSVPSSVGAFTLLASEQTIELQGEYTVEEYENLEFNAIDRDGTKIPIDLGTPDLNGGTKEIEWYSGMSMYSGTLKFTYSIITKGPEINGAKDLELKLGETIDLMNGVSVTDAEDGDLTSKVVVDDSKVDYNKTGSYDVIYSVTDSDGNTTTKTITLTIVRDLTKPVNPVTPEAGSIPTINGTKNLESTLDDTIDLMNGVSASDVEDGDLTSKIIVDDSKVDYNKTGSYDVIYSVTDSDGNTTTKTITLTIVRDLTKPGDTLTPVIGSVPTIDGTKDLTVKLGETIELLDGITATDVEDGDLTASIVVDDSNVDYSKTGSYDVIYSVTDSDGNTTTKTITLTIVRDLTKPGDTLTPVIGSVPTIDGTKDLTVKLGETIDLLANITANDVEDGDLTSEIVVDDSKVDYTKAGKYEVTYSVTDSDGNTTTKKIILEIIDEVDMIDITPADPIDPEKPEVVDPTNPDKPNQKPGSDNNQDLVDKNTDNPTNSKDENVKDSDVTTNIKNTGAQYKLQLVLITIITVIGALLLRRKMN